ncbi:MAG: hypothetical protein WA156_20265 [Methylocystis silviterrae]
MVLLTIQPDSAYLSPAMLETPQPRKQIPYYGSYAGFYRALRELKEKGIPRRIGTRFFGPAVKNEATRVVAGFASLGWTDDLGQPSETLRKIVKSFNEPDWEQTLSDVLPQAYPYLQDLDLETASNADMRDAFVAYIGRDVESLRNAETFFLCIAYEAGRPMAESFARRAERGAGDARRWLKLAESGVLDDDEVGEDQEPRPLERDHSRASSGATAKSTADKIVELSLWLSDGDMTQKEKDAVYVLMAYLARKHKQESP